MISLKLINLLQLVRNPVMASFGVDGPGFAAVRQPITRGPDFPDLFIFSVFDDMTRWSKYVVQLFGTDAGQRMHSHMVVTPDGE